jgi:hypothetical protein
MPASYRLYILDAHDRSIVEVIEIGHRADDEVASDKALTFLTQQPAELWDRARKVCSFEPRQLSGSVTHHRSDWSIVYGQSA